MEKESLFGKTLQEIEEVAAKLELPKFRARQIASWLYQKDIHSIDEMTDLGKNLRERLNSLYVFGTTDHSRLSESGDGTRKYLFPVKQEKFVEAAYIPEKTRNTLCVSSQVGCKMGCLFCMTGKQGFQGNLTPGEIVNQIRSLPEREKLSNIVYMGMGEPFDNYDNVIKSLEILTAEWGFGMSPRRITVSTIGILPAMKRFLEESECHLAVSLHSPFEEERKSLMPVENVYPAKKIVDALRKFDFGRQRRIFFEYIMFKDINDSMKHVKGLTKLLSGMRCRVNLIRFHAVPGVPFESSDDQTIEQFMVALNQKGIRTTIRASRGVDIEAACGLLSTKARR